MGFSKNRTVGVVVLIATGFAPAAHVAVADDLVLTSPLDLGSLVKCVLRRNQLLIGLAQAERAARARAEQEAALSAPMIDYAVAPVSTLIPSMRLGQIIRITQPVSWPGKRTLALKRAEAAVRAVKAEHALASLELAAKAANLFYEYQVIEAQLAINARHADLARSLREANNGRFRAGMASRSEIAATELELGHIEYEEVMLRAARATIVARINGLLHREPEAALPSPRVEDWEETAPIEDLASHAQPEIRLRAESEQPQLARMQAEIDARAHALELAERDRFPDLALMGEYNSMWQDPGHRFMLGVSVELPIFGRWREGRVREAEADLQRARAELAHEHSELAAAVSAAAIKVRESERVLHLFRQRVLTTARTQVEAVRIELASGKTTVAALLQAEHTLRKLEFEDARLSGELGKSQVELDRVLGRLPGHHETGQAGGGR